MDPELLESGTSDDEKFGFDEQKARKDSNQMLMASEELHSTSLFKQMRSRDNTFQSPAKRSMLKRYSTALQSNGKNIVDIQKQFLEQEQERLDDLKHIFRMHPAPQ